MLSITTHTFSPGLPTLNCDVYSTPNSAFTSPGLLFFHAGGLVGGARDQIPPWLVQVCLQRRWPLISASYRFLPQARGPDLLADARAAYVFAQTIGRTASAGPRQLIVAGASAGFFLAALTAHHLSPKPKALLSITGIPTFQHPFFAASRVLTSSPVPHSQVSTHLNPDLTPETNPSPSANRRSFTPSMLLPSGARNPNHVQPAGSTAQDTPARGGLYYYLLQTNAFPGLVAPVDEGFSWAKSDANVKRLAEWPRTVLIQGTADADVDSDVSISTAEALGPQRATLCLAPGMDHRFEDMYFLEDDEPGMEAVRRAVAALDDIVAGEEDGDEK